MTNTSKIGAFLKKGACSSALLLTILSGCGDGGSTITPQFMQSSVATVGDINQAGNVYMSASTGYAATGDDIDNIRPGVAFFGHKSARGHEFLGKYISPTQIEIASGGSWYLLERDPSTGVFEGEFDISVVEGSLFAEYLNLTARITDINPYAKFINISSTTRNPAWPGPDETTGSSGYIGFKTDPAALPAAARYAGTGNMTLYRGNRFGDIRPSWQYSGPTYQDSATGTVQLNADFSAGTVSGQLDFSDPLGDASAGAADLGSFSLAVSGASIDRNIVELQLDTSSIGFDGGNLTGFLYGPNADYLAGSGTISKDVSQSSSSDYYQGNITFNAAKQ